MELNYEWLTMQDGAQIYLRKWIDPNIKARAIVQIAHGMAEHIERYHDFATFLLNNGFYVFGDDHRGHGRTGDRMGIMGYFADHNGFDIVVDDLHEVTLHIKQQYPHLPVFLLGHSLGSFLSRRYIQKYAHELSGVLLSGTAGNPGIASKLGKLVAKIEMRKVGKKSPSPLMNKVIFGSYNKGFENVKNKFAWLSRDEQVVEDYLKDPYCGFICTPTFFYDLLTGLELIHQQKWNERIPRNLPMYIFSGDKDPVGANGIGVKRVIHLYEKLGMKSVDYTIYPEARHETLNEINKEEVYHNVIKWLNHQLK